MPRHEMEFNPDGTETNASRAARLARDIRRAREQANAIDNPAEPTTSARIVREENGGWTQINTIAYSPDDPTPPAEILSDAERRERRERSERAAAERLAQVTNAEEERRLECARTERVREVCCVQCGFSAEDARMIYNEEQGHYFCGDSCYEDWMHENNCEPERRESQPRRCHSWDYPVPVHFHGEGGASNPHQYAVELELCNTGQDYDLLCHPFIQNLTSQGKLYAKADGSSVPHGGMGFEFITQYMTLEQHRSFPWEKLLKLCISRGWRSWGKKPLQTRTGELVSCGFHVSHPMPEKSSLIMWEQKFVYDNPRMIMLLSRRRSRSADRFASLNRPFEPEIAEIARRKDRMNVEKYQAINVAPGRIEFRRYRGTLNYLSLMAYIEATDAILRYCETLTAKNADRCTGPAFMQWARGKPEYKNMKQMLLNTNRKET